MWLLEQLLSVPFLDKSIFVTCYQGSKLHLGLNVGIEIQIFNGLESTVFAFGNWVMWKLGCLQMS